jgi:hypothetical protein
VSNKELHSLDSSPGIITLNKSRRMRGARYVACMRIKRNAYGILVAKPEGRNH